MYPNQHKVLFASESCYVVIITDIPLDSMARRMEGNLGMKVGEGRVTTRDIEEFNTCEFSPRLHYRYLGQITIYLELFFYD